MSEFPFEIDLLSKENVNLLDNFCCGNAEIDRYVKEDALTSKDSGKGVTYVVIKKSNNDLVGYYTLCSSTLVYFDDNDLTGKKSAVELVIRGIPAIEIKMFAVNRKFQDVAYKIGEVEELISEIILGAVIGSIYDIAINILGARMIVLYSTPEATKFYNRNGFLPLEEYSSLFDEYIEDCTPMYMTLFNEVQKD
jgi:hypothetical protein